MTGVLHVVLARKPVEGTVAENCLRFGCGALNIDGCRVKGAKGTGVWGTSNKTINRDRKFNASPEMGDYRSEAVLDDDGSIGRFPANLILGGHAVVQMGEQSGEKKAGVAYEPKSKKMNRSIYGATNTLGRECGYGDAGTAARFFFNFTEQESDE